MPCEQPDERPARLDGAPGGTERDLDDRHERHHRNGDEQALREAPRHVTVRERVQHDVERAQREEPARGQQALARPGRGERGDEGPDREGDEGPEQRPADTQGSRRSRAEHEPEGEDDERRLGERDGRGQARHERHEQGAADAVQYALRLRKYQSV